MVVTSEGDFMAAWGMKDDARSVSMNPKTFWGIVNSISPTFGWVPIGNGTQLYGLDVTKDSSIPEGEFRFSSKGGVSKQRAHEYAGKCEHCGAPNNGNNPAECSYCGTRMEKVCAPS